MYIHTPCTFVHAEEMERKIRNGFDPGDGNKTLIEYFDWWFDTYKKGAVSAGTQENINNDIAIVTRIIGYARLSELDRPTYQKFINDIASQYAKSTL